MQAVKDWIEAGPWDVFENTRAGDLPGELKTAEKLGVKPMHVDDSGFGKIANEGIINWAVTESGELLVIPHTVGTEKIAHTVLTHGGPVVAVGEADIAVNDNERFGIRISNKSGHYLPDKNGLEIGKKAFKECGITFLLEKDYSGDGDGDGNIGGHDGHNGGQGGHNGGDDGNDDGHHGGHDGYQSESDEDDKNGASDAEAQKTFEEQLRDHIADGQDIIHQKSRKELGDLLDRLGEDELTKIFVHDIKLQDVVDLIQDSNRDFRLSETNAVNALIGPDGTTVEVKGPGVQDADILFRDSSGEVVLGREVKCILGKAQKSFNNYVLDAGLKQVQVVGEDGAKEILIQLPAGTTEEDVETRLTRMRGGNDMKKLTAEQVTKLENVQITIVDPSGKVLASEAVLP